RLDEVYELTQTPCSDCLPGYDDLRCFGDETDRIEVLERVIGASLVECGGRCKRDVMHQKCVTIRRSLGDATCTNRAAGASHIFDNDLLSQFLAHQVSDPAREQV